MDKYEKALELARNYYPDNLFLDTIFPELHSRPKSSDNWKPSEEQMEALKYVLGKGGKFDKAALESLYNDLKEL